MGKLKTIQSKHHFNPNFMSGSFTNLTSFKSKYLMLYMMGIAISSCADRTENARPGNSREELIAAANELDSLFLVAFNNGDAEAIMQLHWNSPELRAYPPGEMQVEGYDAVKETYIREFTVSKGARLEYTNANNMPFADGVIGYGTFRWTMPMEGSEPMVFDGRYTEVKAMKDGKMVIVVDHTSMPMPPPPDDATSTQ